MSDDKKVSRQLLAGFNCNTATSINAMNHAIEHENYGRARAIQEAGTKFLIALLPDNPKVQFHTEFVVDQTTNLQIPIGIYSPINIEKSCPVFLWIHGGGMIAGSYKQNEAFLRFLCEELQCVIVGVDYRLAPENPYPAAIDDCYSTLKWIHKNHEKLGIDPEKIAIGGASAGGNLAAALALKARDMNELSVIFQLLIYPMLDDKNLYSVDDQHTDTPLWTRRCNQIGWNAYLQEITNRNNVPIYAAPYRANDLSNLPPATVIVGELDLFLEESIVYAQRLLKAGISTALHVYPGAYHGFDFLALKSDIGKQCEEAILVGLKGAFNNNWVNI